jgi:outer membrane usher protein FimD/PapC
VYFDVKDPDGTVTTWSVELAARSVLTRMGWTGRSLEIGQVVTVTGDRARSGAPMINARARETANIRAGDAEAYRAGKAEAYPITLADGTPVLFDR